MKTYEMEGVLDFWDATAGDPDFTEIEFYLTEATGDTDMPKRLEGRRVRVRITVEEIRVGRPLIDVLTDEPRTR